jgi:hypothetical protein
VPHSDLAQRAENQSLKLELHRRHRDLRPHGLVALLGGGKVPLDYLGRELAPSRGGDALAELTQPVCGTGSEIDSH